MSTNAWMYSCSGFSTFFCVYGLHHRFWFFSAYIYNFQELNKPLNFFWHLESVHNNFEHPSASQKASADNQYLTTPTFKGGDLLGLSTHNIFLKVHSQKLAPSLDLSDPSNKSNLFDSFFASSLYEDTQLLSHFLAETSQPGKPLTPLHLHL